MGFIGDLMELPSRVMTNMTDMGNETQSLLRKLVDFDELPVISTLSFHCYLKVYQRLFEFIQHEFCGRFQ